MAETDEAEELATTERMDQREAEATARIEEADTANRSALDALSAFLRELTDAKRVLATRTAPVDARRKRPDLVDALRQARQQVGRRVDREETG